MLNLDTHILLFALDNALTPTERKLLAADQSPCAVHIWPLDLAVRTKSTELDFSSDPADELIAATSTAHSTPSVNHPAVPAAYPDAQAHWKLYPPNHPVTSTASPMK